MENDGDLFRLFWHASRLGRATQQNFLDRLAQPLGALPDAPLLEYAQAPVALSHPRDALARTMSKRRSTRSFSSRPLSATALGHMLSAFAQNGDGHPYASAGGLYPLHVFAMLNHVQGPLNGHVAWYDAAAHALVPFAKSPPWAEVEGTVNLQLEGVPHVLFFFVIFPDRTLARYGDRGGRFLLIEVGHAAQNLALRLAHDGLVGCEAGGCHDDAFKRLLGLDGTSAGVALGFACGQAVQ